MPALSLRSPLEHARLAGLLAISVAIAGCVTAAGGAKPSGPSDLPSPSPTAPSAPLGRRLLLASLADPGACAPVHVHPAAASDDLGRAIHRWHGRPCPPSTRAQCGSAPRSRRSAPKASTRSRPRRATQGCSAAPSDFTGAPGGGRHDGPHPAGRRRQEGTTLPVSPDAITTAQTPAPGSVAAFRPVLAGHHRPGYGGSPTTSVNRLHMSLKAWPSWPSRRRTRPAASPRTKWPGRWQRRSPGSGPRWATTRTMRGRHGRRISPRSSRSSSSRTS